MEIEFKAEPLHDVLPRIRDAVTAAREDGGLVEFTVADPDLAEGRFDGESVRIGAAKYRCRSHRSWIDIAEQFGCRYLTPVPHAPGLVRIRFQPLPVDGSLHALLEKAEESRERYGAGSAYAKLEKFEEPDYLAAFSASLAQCRLAQGSHILGLGVNRGDSFAAIRLLLPEDVYESCTFTGIDHAASSIEIARTRFDAPNFSFLTADINDLESFAGPRADLCLLLETVQSPGIDRQNLLRHLVQNRLKQHGSLIVTLPNCRYRHGELIYGARPKHQAGPDLSLLIKDVAFLKKYLQQHKFRVTVRGKYHLFVTGSRIGGRQS